MRENAVGRQLPAARWLFSSTASRGFPLSSYFDLAVVEKATFVTRGAISGKQLFRVPRWANYHLASPPSGRSEPFRYALAPCVKISLLAPNTSDSHKSLAFHLRTRYARYALTLYYYNHTRHMFTSRGTFFPAFLEKAGGQGYTRALIHAMGDKPASCDTRKLPSTRPTIRSRLLGVTNLPATIHASCETRGL